jgi:hypothetical protein
MRIADYGSISVGHPSAGFLINGVPMPRGTQWVVTAPRHRWGTQETIDALILCIERVHRQFPGSPPVMLGSISARGGGRLPPHKTHRTGRDADVYFFRKPGANWAQAATREDIDLPRTWALLRCFITETDVDHILIDRNPQQWIKEYALQLGEPASWVESLFSDTSEQASTAVRYAPGHVAHMHVRFVSPIARRLGVALYDRLERQGYIKGSNIALEHTVRHGETLGEIAKKYQTSPKAIQRRSGLKSTRLTPGQKLRVLQRVRVRDAKTPVTVPPRRLPPVVRPMTQLESDTLVHVRDRSDLDQHVEDRLR